MMAISRFFGVYKLCLCLRSYEYVDVGSGFVCSMEQQTSEAGRLLYQYDVHRSFLGTWKLHQDFGDASDLFVFDGSCASSYLFHVHPNVGRASCNQQCGAIQLSNLRGTSSSAPRTTRQARVTTRPAQCCGGGPRADHIRHNDKLNWHLAGTSL